MRGLGDDVECQSNSARNSADQPFEHHIFECCGGTEGHTNGGTDKHRKRSHHGIAVVGKFHTVRGYGAGNAAFSRSRSIDKVPDCVHGFDIRGHLGHIIGDDVARWWIDES